VLVHLKVAAILRESIALAGGFDDLDNRLGDRKTFDEVGSQLKTMRFD
jgi:hypothetical protein